MDTNKTRAELMLETVRGGSLHSQDVHTSMLKRICEDGNLTLEDIGTSEKELAELKEKWKPLSK